jgi:hypothetical protein
MPCRDSTEYYLAMGFAKTRLMLKINARKENFS